MIGRANPFNSLTFLLGTMLCMALLSGCGGRKKAGLPVSFVGYAVPETYSRAIQKLDSEGERNWVLNLNELAVQAMINGDHGLAKKSLDESILNINNVFGSSPESAKARNLFFNEDVKLYKGDPFERSMTFFYRGVLYMQDRDWDNARACFKSAAFQDAFAEEEQNRDDWTLFDYLIGVCEIQLGRDEYAQRAFQQSELKYGEFKKRFATMEGSKSKALENDYYLPLFTKKDNLLVIVQTGAGPRKVRTGRHNQYQAIKKTGRYTQTANVRVDDEKSTGTVLVDSVYFQAATRGGRPIDQLQGRKVVFKDVTGVTGAVATNVGAGMAIFSSSSSTRELGLIILAVGVAVRVVSELTATKADIRTWLSLPDALCLYQDSLSEGQHPLTVTFAGGKKESQFISVPPPGKGVCVILAFSGKFPAILLPPGEKK